MMTTISCRKRLREILICVVFLHSSDVKGCSYSISALPYTLGPTCPDRLLTEISSITIDIVIDY